MLCIFGIFSGTWKHCAFLGIVGVWLIIGSLFCSFDMHRPKNLCSRAFRMVTSHLWRKGFLGAMLRKPKMRNVFMLFVWLQVICEWRNFLVQCYTGQNCGKFSCFSYGRKSFVNSFVWCYVGRKCWVFIPALIFSTRDVNVFPSWVHGYDFIDYKGIYWPNSYHFMNRICMKSDFFWFILLGLSFPSAKFLHFWLFVVTSMIKCTHRIRF